MAIRSTQVASNLLRFLRNKIHRNLTRSSTNPCHQQNVCSYCQRWHHTDGSNSNSSNSSNSNDSNDTQTRRNPLGIQMLSENLHKQVIFRGSTMFRSGIYHELIAYSVVYSWYTTTNTLLNPFQQRQNKVITFYFKSDFQIRQNEAWVIMN